MKFGNRRKGIVCTHSSLLRARERIDKKRIQLINTAIQLIEATDHNVELRCKRCDGLVDGLVDGLIDSNSKCSSFCIVD